MGLSIEEVLALPDAPVAHFFQLPDGCDFDQVTEVINHSFIDAVGTKVTLSRGALPPANYDRSKLLRERAFFVYAQSMVSNEMTRKSGVAFFVV